MHRPWFSTTSIVCMHTFARCVPPAARHNGKLFVALSSISNKHTVWFRPESADLLCHHAPVSPFHPATYTPVFATLLHVVRTRMNRSRQGLRVSQATGPDPADAAHPDRRHSGLPRVTLLDSARLCSSTVGTADNGRSKNQSDRSASPVTVAFFCCPCPRRQRPFSCINKLRV